MNNQPSTPTSPPAWVVLLALLLALPALIFGVAVAVGTVVWLDGVHASRTVHLSAPLAAGATVTIDASNAGLRILAGPEDQVTLDDSLSVRAPTPALAQRLLDQLQSSSSLKPGSGGVRVDLQHTPAGFAVSENRKVVLVIPASAGLILHSDNAAASLQGLGGPIDIATTNGAFRLADISVSHAVHVSSVNGAIDFRGRMTGGTLDLLTTNGAIAVRLPRDVNARYQLDSLTGAIAITGPEGTRAAWRGIGRSLAGQFGDGSDGLISARTTNGAVAIQLGG